MDKKIERVRLLGKQNKIEILSVDLLIDHPTIVNKFKVLSYALGNYPVGWHYLLDWPWIFSQVKENNLNGKVVLDAGVWTGLSQWYLAQRGATGISVDRASHPCLPFHFNNRFRVCGLRPGDLSTIKQIFILFDKSVNLKKVFWDSAKRTMAF